MIKKIAELKLTDRYEYEELIEHIRQAGYLVILESEGMFEKYCIIAKEDK